MLRALVKKQLTEMFRSYFVNGKTGKAQSKGKTTGLLVLFGAVFFFLGISFFTTSSKLGSEILNQGKNWAYFSLLGSVSAAFGLFGSVFSTYAALYLPKDNEFLLSMPIPPMKILLSRVIEVYLFSLLYSGCVWIPATIAYWIFVPKTFANILFPILLIFIIPLFVTVLSCLLGFLLAAVVSKLKNKSILTVIFSLAVIILYYIGYLKMTSILSGIAAKIDEIGAFMRKWFLLIAWLGEAADGNAISMLIFTAITAVLAALCLLILAKTFLQIAVPKGEKTKKSKKVKVGANIYTEKKVMTALRHRELKHFANVPTWMLNGGLGILVLPVGAVAVLIKGGDLLKLIPDIQTQIPSVTNALPVLVLAAVCFLASLNIILPVSVSMEGSSMWILQTLPVDTRKILQAKEWMNIELTALPSMLFAVAFGIVLKITVIEMILLVCTVWVYLWFKTDFELMLNLKNINFTWTNPSTLTKQSMPIMVALFSGWGFGSAIGGIGFALSLFLPGFAVLTVCLVLFSVLFFLMHRWVMKSGAVLLQYC